jgi:hypothetical protein
MSNTKVLLTVGYSYYVGDRSLLDAMDSLNSATQVDRQYVDGKYLYVPKEDIDEIEVKLIDSNCVREPTSEEKENQALKEAKQSLEWAKQETKRKDQEIENLKCKLKLLEKEETLND